MEFFVVSLVGSELNLNWGGSEYIASTQKIGIAYLGMVCKVLVIDQGRVKDESLAELPDPGLLIPVSERLAGRTTK